MTTRLRAQARVEMTTDRVPHHPSKGPPVPCKVTNDRVRVAIDQGIIDQRIVKNVQSSAQRCENDHYLNLLNFFFIYNDLKTLQMWQVGRSGPLGLSSPFSEHFSEKEKKQREKERKKPNISRYIGSIG